MNPAERELAGLIGQLCWGVEWESETNLAMSFGEPHLVVREPVASSASSERVRNHLAHRRVLARGENWLWIWMAYWALDVAGVATTRGSSSRRQMLEALSLLEGQKLAGVTVAPASGRTELTFDLGARLRIRPFNKGAEDDIWILYHRDGRCFAVNSRGEFRDGPCAGNPPWQKL